MRTTPASLLPSLLCLGLSLALLAGCTGAPPDAAPTPPATTSPLGEPTGPSPTPSATPSATREPKPLRGVRPGDFEVAGAMATVRHLAGDIGPRHGTSAAYREAARWVAGHFRSLGLDVRRPSFAVPGGNSWGVPVEPGRSVNVIATAPELDATEPHLVVGAHLDTVPQAPGAEDNASGVGVLLAVAEALQGRRTRLPVVLVAFGAEEPRGPTDDDHHYGSRHYVAQMSGAERAALRAMLSLDRVGVGDVLPVCSAGEPGRLRHELLEAAARAGVRTLPCTGNRASDHWSFVRDGLPGVRLGSTSYAAYHSAADVPSVVNPAQLERAGRTTLAWLSPRGR